MSAISIHRPHIDIASKTTWTHLGRLATYATTLGGVYLSIGFLFYFAAKEKLIGDSGVMPAALRKEFAGSVLASVPGDNAAWVLLGAAEAAVVVLLAVSVLRGEFLANRRKPVLMAGLGLSMLAYGLMGLANDMVGDTATSLVVFTYLGLTAMVMILIRNMAPYRPTSWLAGTAEKS